jgi:hypothetical protein
MTTNWTLPTADEYGEITNSKATYRAIVEKLSTQRAVLVGWTEGSSHFDILFTLKPSYFSGNIKAWQRGMRRDYLYVSIIGIGSFGFSYIGPEFSDPKYYVEKFGHTFGATDRQLATLLNGVRYELYMQGKEF